MKKTKLLGTALFSLALLASCNSVEETPGAFSTLQVKVTNTAPESRAIVTGTILPGGSEIGVTLLDAAGQNYDDVPYANLKYTTANGTDWAVSGATAPLLSATDGKAIAYYPWKDAADYTALAVETASQTDYMYSGWVEGINNSVPEASFTMNHGLSAFRVILKKEDAYKAAATATTVSVKSDAFVASAKMNAVDGALSAWSGEGDVTVDMADITLSTSDQYTDIMVVPAQAAGTKATFTVAVEDANSNSKNYTVDVPFTTAMLQGKCYQFTLTLTATGFEASTVAVTEWGQVTNAGSGSLAPVVTPTAPSGPAIDATGKANGVYIVTAAGRLMDKNTVDPTAIGVALIIDNHKFMIEKTQDYDDTYTTFYWGENLSGVVIQDLTEIKNSDGINDAGYLPMADGSFTDEPHLSNNYKTWTAGVLADFDGKSNTKAISNTYNENSITMDERDMCTILINFNNGLYGNNQSFNDWYIPALGQLALMHLNLTDINTAFNNINGTEISAAYWSSSHFSKSLCWGLGFWNGLLSIEGKNMPAPIRFIRDIE